MAINENDEYNNLLMQLKENLHLSEENETHHNDKTFHNSDNYSEFQLVTGFRSNSTLLWVPSEKCFFKQNAYSKTYDGMAYTCYEKECKARKVLSEEKLITINASHILHTSMESMYKELYYLNLMKEMAQNEPHSSTVSQIFERVQAM